MESLPTDEAAPVFFICQHESQRQAALSSTAIARAYGLGYDLLTARVTTPGFHSRVVEQLAKHFDDELKQDRMDSLPKPSIAPLSPGDTTLTPEDGTSSSLLGLVSPWIDLGSEDAVIAHVSRQILNMEVAYAAFCGISNLIVHGPIDGGDIMQYSRSLREALALGPYIQLHVLLPAIGELEEDHGEGVHLSELARIRPFDEDDDDADGTDESKPFHSWETWDTIRSMSDYSQKLAVALELPRQIPTSSLQSRWYSEPVRFLSFPNTTFLRNPKGYPVLSKPYQQLLSRFARLRYPPWMLLSDVDCITDQTTNTEGSQSLEPTPAEAATKPKEKPKDPAPHLRYLRHLQQNQPPRPPIERFGQGYQDFLQSPLQPLTDNLESITYEVFEKDPVKYEWYERAIAAALKDLRAKIDESRDLIVAVVGSGRGPLISRALRASQSTGVPIKCWAVEKNPNAYVLLQNRNATDPLWNGQVNVVKSDMRHWQGPTIGDDIAKVDILISELLGSFGDNELSPECLDGVQHVLHPRHGISIPTTYSAHLTPISTPRLYSDLLSRQGTEKWELPYVVMLHQYDFICKDPESDTPGSPNVKQVWYFSHPAPPAILEHARMRAGGSSDAGGWVGGDGSNEHNARTRKLDFACQEAAVCHGLAGYFETCLYSGDSGRIELSTNPVTMEEKSKDMISWFPIFFPLKTPLHAPENAHIEVNMWRQTNDRSVWYEWMVEVYEEVGSRRRKLAVSELHSSRKNGCLM